MQYWLDRADVVPEVLPDDIIALHPLFDDARRCEKFVQRVLVFGPGASRERLQPKEDEVLYVLSGSGTLDAGERMPLAEGTAVFVAAGTPWSVEADEEVELVSVLVRDPEAAAAPHAC